MTPCLVSFPPPSSSILLLTLIHLHARSVAMSVGSPALAAYSLVLTAQNARLVYRRAQRIEDGSKDTVARALISLQQVPLELTKDKRLLAFIPINDQWRQEIVERLNRRNAWSLATGSSVAWVIIAFIFTLIDSFVSLDDPNGSSQGHSVGTLWLSLLCLVIGWLWVPTFTCGELKSAISFANRKAARKAAKGIKRGAHKVVNFTKAKFTGLPRRVRGFKKAETDPTPEIPEENEKVKDDSDQEDTEPAKQTGLKPNPVSNPAHQHSTVSFQLPAESQQGHGHLTVSGNPTANQSVVSVARSTAQQSVAQSSLKSGRDRLLISKDRSDSLNHDEFRLAATFNYSRVMGYLTLVDDVVNALNKLAHRKDEVGLSRNRLMLEVVSMILTEETDIRGPYRPTHRCVPSGCVLFDVQSDNPRPRSPVWNSRRGHDNRSFHPQGRSGLSFAGIHHLRRGFCPDLVPHHLRNNLRPHLRNSRRKIHHRQRFHRFHCQGPPLYLPLARGHQCSGVDRDILFPVFPFPRQLLLQRQRPR